jgi:predicted metalloendopeptidase
MRAPSLRVTAVLFLVAAVCLNVWSQAAGKKGVDLASLDKTCEPCEDFYQFANGPLSNMPRFAAAFGCKAGDRMVRPAGESCRIW